MATIKTLNVGINATYKAFLHGTARARQGIASLAAFAAGPATAAIRVFQAGLNKGFGGVRRIAGFLSGIHGQIMGLAGAFGVMGASAAVAMKFDQIDGLKEVADNLGVSTARLSELRHAATLTSSSAEAMDGGLKKLAKNLGVAAAAGGPVADVLAELGLNAAALAAMPVTESFVEISEAMTGIENATDRARIATALFGKSGVDMLAVLQLGKKGLGEMAIDAQKLGASINDIDATRVAQANDAFDRMKAAIGGVAGQIAIKLSPLIEDAANRIAGLGSSGDGAATLVTNGFNMVVRALGFVGDAAHTVVLAFKFARKSIAALMQSVIDLALKAHMAARAAMPDITPKIVTDAFDKGIQQLQLMAVAARVTRDKWDKEFATEFQGKWWGEQFEDWVAQVESKKIEVPKPVMPPIEYEPPIVPSLALPEPPEMPEMPQQSTPREVGANLAGAVQRGSVDAYSAIVRAMASDKKNDELDEQKRQTALLRMQVEIAKRQVQQAIAVAVF